MSHKAKIIIFILAVLLLLPSLATVFLNQSDVKSLITDYVESKTGRTLTIEGDLGIQWGLSPVLYAQQVSFANSRWARTPFAFSADKIIASLSVIALLRGELKITAIELDRPRLWIEWLTETKRFNVDLRKSRKPSKKKSRLFPDWVAIKRVAIRNGEIVYFHKNRDWEFIINDATLISPGNNQPAHIEVSGEIEKTAVTMAGTLGDIEASLRFRESPVELRGYVGVPSNQVAISGVIQNLFRWYGLNLWVDAKVTNLADLSDLFGFWLPPYRNISAKWEFVQPQTARTIRMESLRMLSSAYGLQAYAEGEIGQLLGFNQVDVRFNAKGNLDRKIISLNSNHSDDKDGDGQGEMDKSGIDKSEMEQRERDKSSHLETSVVGRVFGNRNALTLDIEHAEINGDGIRFQTAGVVTNVLREWSVALPLTLKIANLESLIAVSGMSEGSGGIGGLKWADTPPINVVANFNHQHSSFNLQDIKISSAAEDVSLAATGEIRNLGRNYKGEFEFDGNIKRRRLGQISASGFLALLDELSLAGTLSIGDSMLTMSQVTLHGKGDGIALSGTGAVGNLAKFEKFQMDMNATVHRLSKLEALASHKLPHAGSLHITAVLDKDSLGSFNLNNITATLLDADFTMTAQGDILGLGKIPEINLNMEMTLDSVQPIKAMYPQFTYSSVLSQLLPLNGSAQLSSQTVAQVGGAVVDNQVVGEQSGYSLKNIKIATESEQFSGQMHGRIDHIFAITSSHSRPDSLFQMSSKSSVKTALPSSSKSSADATLSGQLSLALSAMTDAEFVAAIDVPLLQSAALSGDMSAAVDIIFADGGIALDNIDVNINSQQSTLHARGAVSRLSPLQIDEFSVKFDAESLAAIMPKTDLPLLADNPAKGTVKVSDRDAARDITLDVEIGGSDIAGQISFIASGAGTLATDRVESKKSYRADLRSRSFDLTELLLESADSDRLFSQAPIKLDRLFGDQGKTQLDINFRADHFKNSFFILDDFSLISTVDKGVWITQVNGTSSRGTIRGNLELIHAPEKGFNQTEPSAQDPGSQEPASKKSVAKRQGKELHARLNVQGENVDFSALTKLEKSATDNAGLFSVGIHLAGVGNSISAIAGNASGSLLLAFSEAKVKNDGVQLIGGDLLLGLLDAINPLTKQAPYLDVDCGVIHFNVERGIAKTTQGLVLKTSKVTFIGGGSIDLGDEKLQLDITAKARTGFGINANSIIKIIRLGGSIKHPKIKVAAQGLIQSGVATGAAIASGGLSLILQGLYDKTRANADVCATAVKEGR